MAFLPKINFNTQTDSYTLALSDANPNVMVEMNKGTANDLTVPTNGTIPFPIGSSILISQYGAGQTTIVAAGGVNVRSDGGKLKINAQYGLATLIKRGADEWYLSGDITT